MSPLNELLTHMNVITHSKHPHMYNGIFLDGDARMMRSAQIIGTHKRLIQAWSLMSLRTPRPLLLLATWRCHNMLIIRGKPRMMLAMQMVESTIRWSLRKFFIACSHSEEQFSDELKVSISFIMIRVYSPSFSCRGCAFLFLLLLLFDCGDRTMYGNLSPKGCTTTERREQLTQHKIDRSAHLSSLFAATQARRASPFWKVRQPCSWSLGKHEVLSTWYLRIKVGCHFAKRDSFWIWKVV